MKIRAVTLGLDLSADILLADPSLQFVEQRLKYAKETLEGLKACLENVGYTVQTTRVAFNSFSEWLLPLLSVLSHVSSDEEQTRKSNESIFLELITKIDQMLENFDIGFCSFGSISDPAHFKYVAQLIRGTRRISASIALDPANSNHLTPAPYTLVAPDHNLCRQAAEVCLQIARLYDNQDNAEDHNRHDNFRFCVSFQTPKNVPFFPVACHASGRPPTVSLGLENGDLIFLACFAAESFVEVRNNLLETMVQTISPIQRLLQHYCETHHLMYAGIDSSINPGLAPQDSVVQGLEHALQYILSSPEEKAILQQSINWPPSSASSLNTTKTSVSTTLPNERFFGAMGTLSAVSSITSALKMLPEQFLRNIDGSSHHEEKLITCGYNGLMLPVMEDITLAARAAALPSFLSNSSLETTAATTGVSLRDLLVFSCVCGVGLDTVPISGEATPEGLAAVYSEVGTLSYRLNKPLTCRVLPMKGLKPGEFTQIPENPYLVNTRVFSIE